MAKQWVVDLKHTIICIYLLTRGNTSLPLAINLCTDIGKNVTEMALEN